MAAVTASPPPDGRVSILPAGTVTFLVADVDQAAGASQQLHRVEAALAA